MFYPPLLLAVALAAASVRISDGPPTINTTITTFPPSPPTHIRIYKKYTNNNRRKSPFQNMSTSLCILLHIFPYISTSTPIKQTSSQTLKCASQGWAGIPVSRDSWEYKPQISLPVAFFNSRSLPVPGAPFQLLEYQLGRGGWVDLILTKLSRPLPVHSSTAAMHLPWLEKYLR